MAILSVLAFLVTWLTWITDKANYVVWIPGLFLYIFFMAVLYHLARKKQDGKRENKCPPGNHTCEYRTGFDLR